MARIHNAFGWIGHAIPAVLEKVGSMLLLAFAFGAIFGYIIGFNDQTWLWLLFPFISMAIMWYELDEGTLVFILGLVLFFFLL